MKFRKYYLLWRYSPTVLRLWRRLRPAVDRELKAQDQYYKSLLMGLKPGDHIAFDIGANEGFVTETLLKKKLRVVAAEPDPRNIGILEARFSHHERFRLYPSAVGDRKGSAPLYLQNEGSALSTLNPKWAELTGSEGFRIQTDYQQTPLEVEVIPLDELIRERGLPCFLKIDVEGYETVVMKGLSRQVPFLIFEANLPEFKDETLECLERLQEIDPNVVFNYASSFQLRLDHWVPYTVFREMLPRISDRCIDVMAIMTNFKDYYSNKPGGIS